MKRFFTLMMILCLLLCGCGEVPAMDPEEHPVMLGDAAEMDAAVAQTDNVAKNLIGIGCTTALEAYQDPWGVKLTVRNVTPTGLVLECRCEDAASGVTGTLQTGTEYALEVLENGVWQPVEYVIDDFGWDAVALLIPEGETTQWEIDWEWLYGALPAGSYRISKTIMDFREAGDYVTEAYYAGFDLAEDTGDVWVSCEYDGFGVRLPYGEGWEYQITEYAPETAAEEVYFGVSFRPAGEDGWVHLQYREWFGVCGTGLRSEEYGNGTMGIYAGVSPWSFISYPASDGYFVATTQNVQDWWDEYEEDAMEILDQAVLTDPAA